MTQHLSPTILKILDILNDGTVHTGSEIALTLGISRNAVWKVIQKLKKYSVEIETKHQGYRLPVPLALFDQKKMNQLLKGVPLKLEVFESIPSTNDYLKTQSKLKNNWVCLSEYQSHGRGRLGRSWTSPFGRNIYCSLSVIFTKDICELSGLSLVVGILVAKALEASNPKLTPQLKWPNDIFINGKKVGGILIDLMAEAHGNCTAVISLGLNVNMKDVQASFMDHSWTSIEHVLEEKLDRNEIAARFIQVLLKGMETFKERGIEPFLQEWKRYDMLHNKKITLTTGTISMSGTARGISPEGLLLLELPDGRINKFSYGDATLRKD
jgi:BirA family biotin operon repressor/biotin-[acetyl-CoA-carboxylase] ligase